MLGKIALLFFPAVPPSLLPPPPTTNFPFLVRDPSDQSRGTIENQPVRAYYRHHQDPFRDGLYTVCI